MSEKDKQFDELFSLCCQMANVLEECSLFIKGGHPTLPYLADDLVVKFDSLYDEIEGDKSL